MHGCSAPILSEKSAFWNIYISLTDDSQLSAFLKGSREKGVSKREIISRFLLCVVQPSAHAKCMQARSLPVLLYYVFSFVSFVHTFLGKSFIE